MVPTDSAAVGMGTRGVAHQLGHLQRTEALASDPGSPPSCRNTSGLRLFLSLACSRTQA